MKEYDIMLEALNRLNEMLKMCTPDLAPNIAEQMCKIYKAITGR